MMDLLKNKKKIIITLPLILLIVGVFSFFSFHNPKPIEPTNHNPISTIPTPYDTEELQIIETTDSSTEELVDKEANIHSSDDVITNHVDYTNINVDNKADSSTSTRIENGHDVSADANKDGVIDTQEATNHISPSEQTMIDAGFGNVVLLPTGNYGVLMPNPDHLINGKDGGDILIEYLAEKGLQASSISGSWMNEQYYNWIAKNISELITPNDEEFWD